MARTTDPAERERRRQTMEEHRITSAVRDVQPVLTGRDASAGLAEVSATQAFLLWARHHRIAISEVAIGATRVVVMDLGLPAEAPSRDDRRAARDADRMYERYGGEALRRFEQEVAEGSTYEDDDEDDPNQTQDLAPPVKARRRKR